MTDLGQEVGYNAVSGPLREEADGDEDDGPVAVTRSRPQLRPAVAFELLLERNGLLDLIEFHVDQFVILVALGMYIGQDLLCLLGLALGNKPAR